MFSKSQIGQEDGAHLPRIHRGRQRQSPEALYHGEDVVLPSCGAERQPGALGDTRHFGPRWHWAGRYQAFWPNKMGGKDGFEQSKKLEQVLTSKPQKSWKEFERVDFTHQRLLDWPSTMQENAERHQHMTGKAGMVQESQAVGQHATEDQKAPCWRLGKVA